jgi:hypothetical protein
MKTTIKGGSRMKTPSRFKTASPEEVSLDLTDPATLGCLLVQVSHLAQQEKEAAILKAQDAPPKWEVLKVSPDPKEWEMHQVQEPMPVNDILIRVLREISINGFRQPLLIGNLLLKALEAAE